MNFTFPRGFNFWLGVGFGWVAGWVEFVRKIGKVEKREKKRTWQGRVPVGVLYFLQLQ